MAGNLKATETPNPDGKYTLHPVQVDIHLPDGEFCYFAGEAKLFEERRITKRILFHGPILRLRLLPGIWYKAGVFNVARQTDLQLTEIDKGTLYVTGRRVLFVGASGSQSVEYKKLLDFGAHKDVFILVPDGGRNKFFVINKDARYVGNLVDAIIKATN